MPAASAYPDTLRVEVAAFAAGLTAALRRAGLPGPPEGAVRLARALRLAPPAERDVLYWVCRVALVSSSAQLPVFDAVFAAVFDGILDPADGRREDRGLPPTGSDAPTRPATADRRPAGPTQPGVSPQALTPSLGRDGSDEQSGAERPAVLAMASPDERLHTTAFAQLAPDELAQMRLLVRQIVLSTPARRSRRRGMAAHRRGRLDIRRTVRAAQRTGGDAARIIFEQRRIRPRRLIMLCDVSASMEPYTQVYLSLLQGAVAGAGAEAFVFSTRLTRLTRQLAVRVPDRALARAAAGASDWGGGTRLAESLRRFLDDHGRRGLAHGAVVVVLSDGWAQDDPEQVDAQMARLRRLAHRIVWVNPRRVAPGYAPLVGGMAAALPYCDAFVSGHSYTALMEVAAAIGADRPRGPGTEGARSCSSTAPSLS